MNNPAALQQWRARFSVAACAFLLAIPSRSAFGQAAKPAAPTDDEVITLEEYRVETNSNNSYLATETTSGTRMAQKVIDLPFSVQSIPSEFFNDFMLFDYDEMNGFISNVKPADSAGAGNGGATLRGFALPQFRNGFSIIQQPDLNNVDRVEVLKGPSSGVYGATAPGGILNFITKQPKSQQQSTLDYAIGSFQYKRVAGSNTGPITKKLFYRVDGTYYDQKRPTDFWYNRTLDLSAALVYRPTSNTTINLEFSFTQRNSNPLPVFTRYVDKSGKTAGLVYTMPDDLYPGLGERLSRFNQAGPYNRYQRYNNSTYLTVQHRFSPNWSLQASVANTNRKFRRSGTSSLGNWSLLTNNWTASRSPYHQAIDYEQDGLQIDLSGKFETPGLKHQNHLGLDGIYLSQNTKSWQLTNTAAIQAALPAGITAAQWQKPNPYDLDLLVRAGQPAFDSNVWPLIDGSTNNLFTEDFGAFYNHMVSMLGDRLTVMGTGRVDGYNIRRQQPRTTNGNLREAGSHTNYATYTVGASYKIVGEKLVAYSSYGSSFYPSPNVDKNTGDVYGNTESKGGEVGLKGILFNQGFSYSVAAFSVTQDNEAVDNPDNPSGNDPLLPALVAGGSSRSRGVGIDLSGRLTSQLSLLGNMGWLDCRTIKNVSDATVIGRRLTNSGPARKGSVGATYSFDQARLKGLKAGLTYYFSTENVRFYGTATSSTVYMPANSYWGAMTSYSFRMRTARVTLKLAATDLFAQQKLTDNAFWPTGTTVRFDVGLKF